MNTEFATGSAATICNGQLVWPRSMQGNRSKEQELQLKEVLDSSDLGLVLDCALVEVGNSEIVNLLMRIRSYAKKNDKELALFNVPDTLCKVINVCKLQAVLPQSDDVIAARKMVRDKASGKSGPRIWFETHPILGVLLVIAGCVMVAWAGYLAFG